MASSIQIYSVTITNGNSNSSPADGFIDNRRIEDYDLDLSGTPAGVNYDGCKAKRRGNMRYREIINQLHRVANCYIIDNTIDNDATESTEASNFGFFLFVERGGAMVTADESNPGSFLNDGPAIKRCIARALIADCVAKIDVVDPTSDDSIGVLGDSTSAPRFWVRIVPDFEAGSYAADIAEAEALIAVAVAIPTS